MEFTTIPPERAEEWRINAMRNEIVADAGVDELPTEEALSQLDARQLNMLISVQAQLTKQANDILQEYEDEVKALETLRMKRMIPLQEQIEYLDALIQPVAARLLAENGNKPVKLLRATIKQKPGSWGGSIRDAGKDDLFAIATAAGLFEVIRPEEIIPPAVRWGELKKHLVFTLMDGEQSAILKDTGEDVTELLDLTYKAPSVDIKFA